MKTIYMKWTQLQINRALQLRSKGHQFKEIADTLNTEFNTSRSMKSVQKKVYDMIRFNELTNGDLIIIKHIKANPLNLRYAFTQAGIELNVTSKKVESRYYYALKKTIPMVTVGSQVGFSNNVKNLHVDKEGNLPNAEMNTVQWMMKQILNLSKEDRDKIISLLT